MKNGRKIDPRRIQLGRVSTSTRGGVYGTIEKAGLLQTAIQL
jgi:hypothetical protein